MPPTPPPGLPLTNKSTFLDFFCGATPVIQAPGDAQPQTSLGALSLTDIFIALVLSQQLRVEFFC